MMNGVQNSMLTNGHISNVKNSDQKNFNFYNENEKPTYLTNDNYYNKYSDQHEAYLNSFKNKDPNEDKYGLMRSTLFVDDEIETMSKKCRNISFTKQVPSQVSSTHQIMVGSTLLSNRFKATIPKKRRLVFEPKPSTKKASIYSIHYSEFPKVCFTNGSNRFCLIVGTDVLIFEVNLLYLDQENSIEKLEQHLESHSTIEKQNQNTLIPPLIVTNPYTLNTKFDHKMNSLVEALYGELSETADYARHQERLRRILGWLFNYNKALPVPENSYQRIIHFLTTNELEFAITECIESRLPRLSYLVSCGQYCKKELIFSQLDLWKRSEADNFIEKDLLKIYVILSGLITWTLSNGQEIEPLVGLEWTQQLTLLLLYKVPSDGSEMIGTNLVKSSIEELTYKPNIVEYHLLAQHQPYVAITSASNQLDSWFLQESLQSYNVIMEDVITNKSDSINLFMASQTRNLKWALFFALHIRNDFIRSQTVQELLTRNAQQLNDDLEDFLIETYGINTKLITDAKLCLKQRNNNNQEQNNLLDIGQYWSSLRSNAFKLYDFKPATTIICS